MSIGFVADHPARRTPPGFYAGRRRMLLGASALLLTGAAARAQDKRPAAPGASHRVAKLGLEISVENQPPWDTSLTTDEPPSFIAQSPEGYFAPSVMTWQAWPKQRLPQQQMEQFALGVFHGAGPNFGLSDAQLRLLRPVAASYGVLQGFETGFPGKGQGMDLDVKIFVGQTPGRFPVCLLAYAQRGKIGQLTKVLRRNWEQIRYLGA